MFQFCCCKLFWLCLKKCHRDTNNSSVSPNSAFIHMIRSQHILACQNFSHLVISRYIEIWHSKFNFLICGLYTIWMNFIRHLLWLQSPMIFYWFCHLNSRRNWFMNALPFNPIIGFCLSCFKSNLIDYWSIGEEQA